MVKITKKSGEFIIEFRYSERLVTAVKQLPGRRFDVAQKSWRVPLSSHSEVLEFAEQNKTRIIDSDEIEARLLEVPPMPELDIEIPLNRELYPYQKQGVAYGIEKKRIIVGDQPGLGKTAQAIATLLGAEKKGEESFPCLVICPSTLKINWQREWMMWGNERALILNNDNKNRWPLLINLGKARVFIVNYESLKKYFVESIDRDAGKITLKQIKFKSNIGFFNSVIIDESHRCKAFNTLQTKFVKGISSKKNYVLALTGTPVVNKPQDLVPQLGIIDQLDALGGYKKFMNRYVDNASSEMHQELSALLRINCFYRREKHEVLKDLPSKQRQIVLCDITNRPEYKEAEKDVLQYLAEWKNATDEELERAARGKIMVQIGNLKAISARGKMDSVFDFVDDVVESGEKIIVFAHHHEILDQLIDRYKSTCVAITGRVSNEDRQIAVDRFQNDSSVLVAVCGIKAAGVGITLTASSRVAFVELAWHPADHEQCEDRAHRIGQNDSVQCTYFIGRETYDEAIYQIINEKREMSNNITGAIDNTNEDVFNSLLELMVNENGTIRIHSSGSQDEVLPATLF